MIIDFKVPNVLDRIPLKHCFSNVNARRGDSQGGRLCGGSKQRSAPPLRLLLIDFLAEARKPPPEAPSLRADGASGQNIKTRILRQQVAATSTRFPIRVIPPNPAESSAHRFLIPLPPECHPRRSGSWWAGRQRFWASPGRRRRRGPARYRCRFPCRQ